VIDVFDCPDKQEAVTNTPALTVTAVMQTPTKTVRTTRARAALAVTAANTIAAVTANGGKRSVAASSSSTTTDSDQVVVTLADGAALNLNNKVASFVVVVRASLTYVYLIQIRLLVPNYKPYWIKLRKMKNRSLHMLL
jgi:ferric-dicitrate binding protein FerR (iron transport regulator)